MNFSLSCVIKFRDQFVRLKHLTSIKTMLYRLRAFLSRNLSYYNLTSFPVLLYTHMMYQNKEKRRKREKETFHE